MCEEMQNLDAMHHNVMLALTGRTEFADEKDAQAFFDTGCQYLSSILLAKYRRHLSCHSKPEKR